MRATAPRALLLAAAAAALSSILACEPAAGPVQLGVLAYDPATGLYGLQAVEVTTLTDLSSLRGDAATLIGSAEIKVDIPALPEESTEAEFRETVIVDEGGDVEAQFLEEDGVLWPQDFHSLALATSYYNLERARLYALARGMAPDSGLSGLSVYYSPDFRLIEQRGDDGAPYQDNAAFYPALHSFIIFPFAVLQEVPLAMNQGVVAHEYGHAIFNAVAHGGSWMPESTTRWHPADRGAALLGSLEEGYADAWGVAVSGDPRFAPHSFGDYLGETRDLDRFDRWRHCYDEDKFDADLREGLSFSKPVDQQQFWLEHQYFVGSVFAAALYRAGQEPGTSFDRVMDAVLRSYADVGELSLKAAIDRDPDGSQFGELAVPVRALVAGADPETRTALCAVFFDRLKLVPAQLGAFCDGVTQLYECP